MRQESRTDLDRQHEQGRTGSRGAVVAVAAVIMLITTLAQAQWTPTYTATWTGAAADGYWFNEANWSWADDNQPGATPLNTWEKEQMGFAPADEVSMVLPDAVTAVVFSGQHAAIDEIVLGTSDRTVGSFLFAGDMPPAALAFSRGTTGSMNWNVQDGIVIQNGAPAIRLDLGGGSGLVSSQGDLAILNQSGQLFQLGQRMSTSYRIDGSGDVRLLNETLRATSTIILEETFSGTFSPGLIQASGSVILNGGTMVHDSRIESELDMLTVNNATLTGNGRIGVIRDDAGSRYDEDGDRFGDNEFNLNAGAIVDPGRVGEVGTLRFENFPVNFNEGSMLRLDLYSAELDAEDNLQYDRLMFEKTGTPTASYNPDLILATTGDGVQLSLNLLPGFAPELDDVFTILSGYSSLTGHFKLADGTELLDGTEFEVNGTQFRINYEVNSHTTLAVIPEPGTFSMILLGGLAVLGWRCRWLRQ